MTVRGMVDRICNQRHSFDVLEFCCHYKQNSVFQLGDAVYPSFRRKPESCYNKQKDSGFCRNDICLNNFRNSYNRLMVTKFHFLIFLFFFLTSVFCTLSPAFAACANPVKDAGDIVYNSDYHVPQYCNGTTWRAMGRIWTGASGGGCTDPVGTEGVFVYNADYAVMQYCDSSVWRAMGLTAAFFLTFTDQTGVVKSTIITSNTITIPPGYSNVTATCGTGCMAISINSGAFVAGPVAGVDGGDSIAIRQTSSASEGTTTTATVTVGTTTSAVWSVTTIGPGFVEADGTVYVGLSPDGNVPMYTTPCDIGMTGTHNNCTGTRTTSMWGTYDVATGYTSTVTGESNTTNLVANYGSYDDGYTIGVPAAQACADQTFGGHSDWYLPALDELHLFWIGTPAAIGGFDVSEIKRYWSSTEASAASAWVERFSDGSQYDYYTKRNLYIFRCVRK